MAKQILRRRPDDAEILARLSDIAADSRFQDEPAKVEINAPLALIQVNLEAEARALACERLREMGIPHTPDTIANISEVDFRKLPAKLQEAIDCAIEMDQYRKGDRPA